MVEFNIKIHKEQGTAYIPKEVRNAFGLKVKLLPNATAGVIYPANADLPNVIQSLELLLQDLKLRVKLGKEGESDE